ncbi:hypothetical protein ACIQXW_17490 [Lysinibacillus sp. NPDC097162]|uniref:hypothetical protein n=1 Tax=Lysinibacillus sp. NPDC097162 TaxID=3364140 RepID=UPI00382CAD11
MTYTLEQVGRVLSKLNLGVSVHSAKKLVDNGKLKRIERPHYCQNTAYNFLVDIESLETYLVNEIGLNANEVSIALFGGSK